VDLSYLNAIYGDMEGSAVAVIRESSVAGAVTIQRTADMRYAGQGYELTIPVPDGVLDAGAIQALGQTFHAIYAQRYGYSAPDEPIEATTWKLTASGLGPTVSLPRYERTTESLAQAQKASRPCWFPETGGYTQTCVYNRYKLFAGAMLSGPAIVEERESTTVLPPGAKATVDEYANLLVEF